MGISPFVDNAISADYSKVIGKKDLLENFSKSYTRTSSKDTLVGKFTGKWTDCIKFQKTYHPGYEIESKYYVVSTQASRLEGGNWGQVVVTAEYSKDNSTTTEGQLKSLGEPVWGLTNQEVSQPLHFHPDFPNKEMQVDTTAKPITMNSIKIWLAYINSPTYVQSIGSFRIDPNNENSIYCPVPDGLAEWKELYDKGRESYVVYMPVISKTTQYSGTPDMLLNTVFSNVDDFGHICTPKNAPGGWTMLTPKNWLKTQDDVSWDGASRFTRTEQWTGGIWPELLYSGNKQGD